MLYALHHESGEIYQANKLYVDDHKPYENLLGDLGHRYAKANAAGLLPPEHWFVDKREITERPVMPIAVSKTRIKCGNDDSALLTNCPKAARFAVHAAGSLIHAGQLEATELQLFIPVPCVYRVTLDLWPFKTFSVDVEAFAS